MLNSLLYDLLKEHYKVHFLSEYCDNCLSPKPTRVIVTRKCLRFFLCDVCTIKLHDLKKEKSSIEKGK